MMMENEIQIAIAALLVGAVCGLLSFFVVHRKLAFLGHGASHGMVAGVGLALWMHWPVFPLALLAALFVSIGVGWITNRGAVGEDSAIGIMLSGTLALGLVFAALHGETHIGHADCGEAHVEEYLVGSLTTFTQSDFYLLIALSAVVISLVVIFWKLLLSFTYDPEGTAVAGYPVTFIRFALLTALAFAIAITMKIVGILLSGAFLVIPAAAAGYWFAKASRVAVLSIVLGAGCSIGGYWLSTKTAFPAGATIVLVLTVFFLISRVFGTERE